MRHRLAIVATRLAICGMGTTSFLMASATPALAETQHASQTVTFIIRNMTCALCPVTVKKAMEGVKGVKSVAVNFEAKTATVVFDPSVATATSISAASANAGYPAAIKAPGK